MASVQEGPGRLTDAFPQLLLGSLPEADGYTKRPQQRTRGTESGCSLLGKYSVGKCWKHSGWHT